MYQLQYKRLSKSKFINEVVIITSNSKSDNVISEFSKNNGFECFRGSENDILSRINAAADDRAADLIVQTTGDCPLIDAELIDKGISFYLENSYDLVGNNLDRTFPIGLDYRIFSKNVIKKANEICSDEIHRSHGSTYIYSEKGKEIFTSYNISAENDYNYPTMRLTVDTPEDLLLMNKISERFENLVNVESKEIISFLNLNKSLAQINSNVRQKTIEEG